MSKEGPLNAFERWASNPKKEAINTGKSLGHIAYSIGLKLSELESAADLAEQGKIAESEKMYDKINSDISTFTKNINDRLSKMSKPEFLEAITECATDFYITGKVINSSIKVFKHAKANGFSPHDSFNILNSQGLMPISELHPACADFLINSPKAFGKAIAGIDSAAVIADKIKQGLDLSAKEVRDFIKASPEYSKNLEQLEQIVEKLTPTTSDVKFGFVEDSLNSLKEWETAQEKALNLYNKFRNRSTDVIQISKNTGINKKIIQEIKNHMFNNEHLLQKTSEKFSMARFDPDLTQALAWERLATGKFVRSDLKLLLHEYTESLIMKNGKTIIGNAVKYPTAHNSANKIHNWQNSVR